MGSAFVVGFVKAARMSGPGEKKKEKDTPWYKNPWVMGGVGLGGLGAGLGAYYWGDIKDYLTPASSPETTGDENIINFPDKKQPVKPVETKREYNPDEARQRANRMFPVEKPQVDKDIVAKARKKTESEIKSMEDYFKDRVESRGVLNQKYTKDPSDMVEGYHHIKWLDMIRDMDVHPTDIARREYKDLAQEALQRYAQDEAPAGIGLWKYIERYIKDKSHQGVKDEGKIGDFVDYLFKSLPYGEDVEDFSWR